MIIASWHSWGSSTSTPIPPAIRMVGRWIFSKAHREHIESFGLILDMIQLPLSSRGIEQQYSPDILTAGPSRDHQIDSICRLIQNAAAAGIPSVKYNLNIIGIPRTALEIGRGGSRNEAFRWERADHDAPPSTAGILGEEENWERIDYFLSRVVPVAESCKVRLACHPHDPTRRLVIAGSRAFSAASTA